MTGNREVDTLSCMDVARVYSFTACCDSCHDDADAGWYDSEMMHVTLKDGQKAHVCCGVFHALQDRKMLKEHNDG